MKIYVALPTDGMVWSCLLGESLWSQVLIYASEHPRFKVGFEVDKKVEGMKALLCAAVGFEAFINALGAEKYPYSWAAVQDRSVEERIRFIAEETGFEVFFDRSPFQHWERIDRFRRDIVQADQNGAGERSTEGDSAESDKEDARPQWEKECTDNLFKNCDAVDSMISILRWHTKYRVVLSNSSCDGDDVDDTS